MLWRSQLNRESWGTTSFQMFPACFNIVLQHTDETIENAQHITWAVAYLWCVAPTSTTWTSTALPSERYLEIAETVEVQSWEWKQVSVQGLFQVLRHVAFLVLDAGRLGVPLGRRLDNWTEGPTKRLVKGLQNDRKRSPLLLVCQTQAKFASLQGMEKELVRRANVLAPHRINLDGIWRPLACPHSGSLAVVGEGGSYQDPGWVQGGSSWDVDLCQRTSTDIYRIVQTSILININSWY